AERPERDAVAIRRRSAVVPEDLLDQPVDVLQELPGEPRLADPGRPDDRDKACAVLAARRVEQILEEPEIVIPADERGLERIGAVPTTDFGNDSQRAPSRDRARLALEHLLARFLERDRLRGGAMRSFVNEHGAWRCDG